jgi:putative transposase
MAMPAPASRPGISFVAMTTHDRRPVFEIARVAELFIETLLHYRTQGYYKLHAYVVLPDHVHLLLTPQSIPLEKVVALIKDGFVHRLNSPLPVWEQSFIRASVANHHDLEIVRAYLHQLPVRAELAPTAELYPHSSAYRQTPSLLQQLPTTPLRKTAS